MAAKEFFLRYLFLSFILAVLVVVLVQHNAFTPLLLFLSCFVIYGRSA